MDNVTISVTEINYPVTIDVTEPAVFIPAWGNIQGDIEDQQDLVDYVSTHGGGGGSQIQSDWTQVNNLLADYIKNKPTTNAGFAATTDKNYVTDAQLNNIDTIPSKEPLQSQLAIAALAIDWTYSHHFKTLGANSTFTFANASNAKTIIVSITNTASNYIVTWPTVEWGSAGAPNQRIGAATDIYIFTQINGIIYGSVRQ